MGVRPTFKDGAGFGLMQRLTGWAPASGVSTTLTVMPAGHAAGIYEVSAVAIVRTTGAFISNGSVTLAFSSPGLGAESGRIIHQGFTVAAAATLNLPTGASTTQSIGKQSVVCSDGVNAMVVTFNPGTFTGSPVIDIYGCARLAAPFA